MWPVSFEAWLCIAGLVVFLLVFFSVYVMFWRL